MSAGSSRMSADSSRTLINFSRINTLTSRLAIQTNRIQPITIMKCQRLVFKFHKSGCISFTSRLIVLSTAQGLGMEATAAGSLRLGRTKLSSKETSQRWRAVHDILSDLMGSGVEPDLPQGWLYLKPLRQPAGQAPRGGG